MSLPFIEPTDELTPFPAVDLALDEPNGLLAAGGSLSSQRLLSAYQQGIFPWFEEGEPILWWSPDPRCVIKPDNIYVSRSLKKTMRNSRYNITSNKAFGEVISQCGAPRASSEGTWITNDMIEAYTELHRLGIAQSIEVWLDDELAGGLYGIVLGRVFIGESMFSKASNTSKMALVHVAKSGLYDLIDCQIENPHLMSMGAEMISRAQYVQTLVDLGDLDRDWFGTNAD